jgi:small-conductance mechanosensitive channel
MDNLLEWLAKFFGHLPLEGVESFLVESSKAVFFLAFIYVVLRILVNSIDRRFKKNDQSNDAAIQTNKRVSRIVLWPVGILGALHVAGVNLTTVFTTGGLFAVAVGFALKDIAGNYIGGLIIKANDSIKHGDVLEVDGLMVRVKSVGLRDTIVRNKDGLDILIPNILLVQGKIGNYTLRDSICRVWTAVGVSYSSDLKKVREVLEGVCTNFDGPSTQHAPVVLLTDFGESTVNYQVFFWTETRGISER